MWYESLVYGVGVGVICIGAALLAAEFTDRRTDGSYSGAVFWLTLGGLLAAHVWLIP